MNLIRKIGILFVAMACLNAEATLESLKARVPDLVKAKDAGLIGEQRDGMVGIVDSSQATPAVRKLVEAENQDRLKLYRERAEKQEQTLEIFSTVMGEARIKGEKDGRFVQGLSGEWIRK
jgi:uncharacterized protein